VGCVLLQHPTSTLMKNLCILSLLLAAACAAPQPTLAPDVTTTPLVVTDMEGETHDLDAALAGGEAVALIFWQSW
jgi:hypothetical protein